MFKLFTSAFSYAVWRGMYCEGQFERCEPLRISKAGGTVPERLLPNGRMLLDAAGSPPPPSVNSPPVRAERPKELHAPPPRPRASPGPSR